MKNTTTIPVCSEVKGKLRDYLEDLLPEASRLVVRAHLQNCDACKNSVEEFGTFASDLRRLARIPVPSNLGKEILAVLDQKKSSPFKDWPAWIRMFFLPLLLIGFLFAALHHMNGIVRRSKTEPKKSKTSSSVNATEVLAELKHIEASLAKRSRTGSLPPEKSDDQKVKNPAVNLRPFHGHLEFEDTAGRNSFLKKLRSSFPGPQGLYTPFDFESPDFAVLFFQTDDLKKFFELIHSFSGLKVTGLPGDISRIPDSAAPVRISLSMRAKNQMGNPNPTRHWHFRFLLPNRYLLLEDIKREGMPFLYESEELWILEVTSEQYATLLQLTRDARGLTGDLGPDADTNSIPNHFPLHIAIYISQG